MESNMAEKIVRKVAKDVPPRNHRPHGNLELRICAALILIPVSFCM
jgi:hypothetical protein